jgi:hypothetical protein
MSDAAAKVGTGTVIPRTVTTTHPQTHFAPGRTANPSTNPPTEHARDQQSLHLMQMSAETSRKPTTLAPKPTVVMAVRVASPDAVDPEADTVVDWYSNSPATIGRADTALRSARLIGLTSCSPELNTCPPWETTLNDQRTLPAELPFDNIGSGPEEDAAPPAPGPTTADYKGKQFM